MASACRGRKDGLRHPSAWASSSLKTRSRRGLRHLRWPPQAEQATRPAGSPRARPRTLRASPRAPGIPAAPPGCPPRPPSRTGLACRRGGRGSGAGGAGSGGPPGAGSPVIGAPPAVRGTLRRDSLDTTAVSPRSGPHPAEFARAMNRGAAGALTPEFPAGTSRAGNPTPRASRRPTRSGVVPCTVRRHPRHQAERRRSCRRRSADARGQETAPVPAEGISGPRRQRWRPPTAGCGRSRPTPAAETPGDRRRSRRWPRTRPGPSHGAARDPR